MNDAQITAIWAAAILGFLRVLPHLWRSLMAFFRYLMETRMHNDGGGSK